jgi:hypothetical protein
MRGAFWVSRGVFDHLVLPIAGNCPKKEVPWSGRAWKIGAKSA